MYLSFSNKIYSKIDSLTENLLTKCEFHNSTIQKEKLAIYLYNQYHFLTKSAFHVEQALETAKKYNYQSLAPAFSKHEFNTKPLEKQILQELDSLELNEDKIKDWQIEPSLPKLLRFLDQISTIDPESFLIYQYFIKALSQKMTKSWKECLNASGIEITTNFSLTVTYPNLSRPEFFQGLDFIGRAIKKSSQERVFENLGLSYIKVENYILDLSERTVRKPNIQEQI